MCFCHLESVEMRLPNFMQDHLRSTVLLFLLYSGPINIVPATSWSCEVQYIKPGIGVSNSQMM